MELIAKLAGGIANRGGPRRPMPTRAYKESGGQVSAASAIHSPYE